MLVRFPVAIALALLGLLATTGVSSAADLSDRDKVMIGTVALAAGLMAVLLVFYMIRHALGLDRLPPPEPDSDAHEPH